MTIHSDDAAHAVDLALPNSVCLGQLLPSVVDVVHRDSAPPPSGGHWCLCRIGGAQLDDALTLQDNDVRDGDVLWLVASEPLPPRWRDVDPSHLVARSMTGHAPRWVPVAGGLAASVTAAVALVWSAAMSTVSGQLMTAGGMTAAAFAGALATRRAAADPSLCVTLGMVATMFAAVAGGLAVPTGPAAAHLLLASTAAFSVSTLLLRLTAVGIAAFTALTTGTLLAAVVSAAVLAWHLTVATAGALLAMLALAALSVAPRASVAIARIGPAVPSVDGPEDAAEPGDGDRVQPAHDVLTGLVTGSAATAAAGGVLAACGVIVDGGPFLAATLFDVTIALVLLLRVRTHPHAARRSALAASGFVGGAASFVIAMAAAPQHGPVLSLLAMLVAAGALGPLLGRTAGLRTRRFADGAEYLALAAVVPLACWVGEVYGVVRDLALR